jgi:hypothetical protein
MHVPLNLEKCNKLSMLDSLFHNKQTAQEKLRHKPQTHSILLKTLAASYNPTIVKLKIK